MSMVICPSCTNEMPASAPHCRQCGTARSTLSKNGTAAAEEDAIPDGVRGWSWGAFFLSWIWAIGNRTWIGLLALVPYVGIGVAIWLGFKGREMAWKNASWDNVEHFNRVQRTWSQWGVGLVAVVIVMSLISGFQSTSRPGFSDSTVQNSSPSHRPAADTTLAPAPAKSVVAQL